MRDLMLVAGLGNIFLGDDGFGVEVAKQLASESLPVWVKVVDFGIRSLHLAYELLDRNYALVVLLDLVQRGGTPGTIYLIEPEPESRSPGGTSEADPHGMTPQGIFAAVRALGGTPGTILIVGCEPESTGEGIGLSAPVARGVGDAAALVKKLICEQASRTPSPPRTALEHRLTVR